MPSDEQVEAVKQNVGYDKLEVRREPTPGLKKSIPTLTIDLSGVAKGYSADLAGKALEELGLDSYMLEIGGEIRCRGEKVDPETLEREPWVLGIQTPESVVNETASYTPEMYRHINFKSYENAAALATSGDYRNFLQVGDRQVLSHHRPTNGKTNGNRRRREPQRQRLGSARFFEFVQRSFLCRS